MPARNQQVHAIKASHNRWRRLIPVLYDWFCHNHLIWPSLSCRWGQQLEFHKYKVKQRLYLSEQTDGSVPNTLVIATVEVVKPRVAAAQHINSFQDDSRSPFVKKTKTIIHPGEVNRIRELAHADSIVVTHTDSPEILVWNTETQPNRSLRDVDTLLPSEPSIPDLVLTGHTENAEFALATSQSSPFVLSGGKDTCVILWSLEDHTTGGAVAGNVAAPGEEDASQVSSKATRVAPRGIFKGHSNTVEDVQFHPTATDEFCSVGDDCQLLLWDARSSTSPVTTVELAHSQADLHCVDWNPIDHNLILTGAADSTVKLFDRRQLATKGPSPSVHTFEGHSDAVLCVQWNPHSSSVFGSSAKDSVVNIWDTSKVGASSSAEDEKLSSSSALLFKHAGHGGEVVDFQWNALDPWTIASVSDEADNKGGSSLQLWRINDIIYRPKEEVLEELGKHSSIFHQKH